MAATPTRRQILALQTGAITGLVLGSTSGCNLLATDPENSESEGRRHRSPRKGEKEAPELSRQVKAGDLPDLGKRLPAEPVVIKPSGKSGVYGGTWNMALLGPSDTPLLARTIGYDYLVRWDPDWTEPVPNVAASVDTEDAGRRYTFTLRRGLKWSDGRPFTADDVAFAYEDVLGSADIYPEGPPVIFQSKDGSPAHFEKLDTHTVRFTFDQPAGLFLQWLATPNGSDLTSCPRHYLKKYHPTYNPDAGSLAEEAGVSSWVDLFAKKRDAWTNVEVPTLFGWRITTALGSGSRVTAQRNPYYWKVDPAGRQLPYISTVRYSVINNAEAMLLSATHGDIDFQARTFNSLENKPVLARNRKKGGYHFTKLVSSTMNSMVIMLNLTHEDRMLREIFQSLDFRIGLSRAINRKEIIGAVFQKQGVPWQAAPRSDSDFYDEDFAHQYLTYDVDAAGRHLDRAGHTTRDGSGFRLRPDGGRISIAVEVAVPAPISTWVPAMQMVKDYWKAVGIETRVKTEDRTLWSQRVNANKHDAAVWGGAGGLQDAIMYGYYYVPFHAGSRYAILWYNWYSSGGRLGEKPPEQVRHQLELYDRVKATVDKAERHKLFGEVLAIAKEQFYVMGTVLLDQAYGIVADDFHNVPSPMPAAYLYGTPGPTHPEQYFIDEE